MAEKLILPELHPSDELFLHELSGRIGELASAHIDSEKEFIPRDFEDEIDQAVADGELDLSDEKTQIPDAVKDALFINLLTEEGLPYYTSTIQSQIPLGHPIREWSHLWTADEGRHGPTISGFLHKTKQFSMRELERARMAMMRKPETPQPESFVESLIYPAIQEPATEISHRNTMKYLPKAHKIGRKALGFVVGDEIRHGKFYREATAAAIEINPSLTVIGIARQIRDFAMPGKSIPGFKDRAKAIEAADIFGLKQLRQIYEDLVVERLGVLQLENLTHAAEQAREDIVRRFLLMDKKLERRAEATTSA